MAPTTENGQSLVRADGWRGRFIGLVITGLVSGVLSVLSGALPSESIPSTYIALIPGVLYGGLSALFMRISGLTLTRTAVLFFIAVIFIWGAAVHFAPATCGDWLHGSGFFCSLAAAGLMGGGIGATALAVFSAFLIPEFRKPYPIIAMIAIGLAGGGLLSFGEFPMFVAWQGGMNLVLGYVLARRAPPQG
jgi:hypothetical protein